MPHADPGVRQLNPRRKHNFSCIFTTEGSPARVAQGIYRRSYMFGLWTADVFVDKGKLHCGTRLTDISNTSCAASALQVRVELRCKYRCTRYTDICENRVREVGVPANYLVLSTNLAAASSYSFHCTRNCISCDGGVW